MGHQLNLKKETEIFLLRRLSEGDQLAFSELFQAYKGKLYSFLLSITRSGEVSEDIVQDVFLKIWHNRESCLEIDNFNAWVYSLAKNSAIDQLKRVSREMNVLADINRNSIKFSAEDPLEKLKAVETNKRIEDAISKMPKQQRLVYQLHREQGLKHEEITKKLNLSVSTIRSHFMNAMVFLKKSLIWLVFFWFYVGK